MVLITITAAISCHNSHLCHFNKMLSKIINEVTVHRHRSMILDLYLLELIKHKSLKITQYSKFKDLRYFNNQSLDDNK